MIFLVLFALVISFLAWYQIKFGRRNALLANIPAPKEYPLIYNTLSFFGKTPQEVFVWLEKMAVDCGPIYKISSDPFNESVIVISEPKAAEAILSSQKLIDKSDDYDFMKAWLGTGLLVSTGKKWFQRRKIITPAFHFQILEKFVEIMDEQGKTLIENLEKFDGKEVDVFPLVNLYALDVICGMFRLTFSMAF